MASLRRELSEYASACEQLMTDAVPFTQEELQWIGYYATEVAQPCRPARADTPTGCLSRTTDARRLCRHVSGAPPRKWTIRKGDGSDTPLDLGGHEGNPVPKGKLIGRLMDHKT